ncbi:MAG: hypothetical protein R3C49_09645 [Planctomycetaceae bacterium]
MTDNIQKKLAPVIRRMRYRAALAFGAMGLLIGAVVSLVTGMVGWLMNSPVTAERVGWILVVSTAVGLLAGLLKNVSLSSAASLVDHCFCLKDRILTAVRFRELSSPSDLQQLQILDADEVLQALNLRQAVPMGIPRECPAIVVLLLATGRILLAGYGTETALNVVSQESVQAEVQVIEEEIQQLEALAEETDDSQLQDLADRLKQDLKTLKVPVLEMRESLKTLSEMQQKMKAAIAEMDLQAMDAQLQEVGEALSVAKPFQNAANALDEKQYSKAADELQQITEEELDLKKLAPAEARSAAEQLAKAADRAQEEDLKELADILKQLSESVKGGDGKEAQKQSEELGQQVRKHQVNHQLKQLLENSSDQLAESKLHLAAQSNSEGDGNMSGKGLNESQGQSDKTAASSSQKAGAKSAGNIHGPQTELESQRQMARLSGQLNENGDTETETITSATPDSPQTAQRQAVEAFTKYQKLSDAVLDSESIPAGHRRMIQNYFERIRPSVPQTETQAE